MNKDVHVSIQNLSKRYEGGSTLAVSDFNLEIERGEFVSLLGGSGSGKTSVLMMLAGFLNPSAGTILIDGRSVLGVPPNARGIGVVFQNYALFPKMTVEQNVGFSLFVRGKPKSEIRDRVRQLLGLIRLEGFEKRYPHQLSGGQQQRVALARSLAFRPELLLLDEPMGALDRKLREELQLEVRRIQRELNVTTLYVTHDQSEALTMSDRIAIMREGKIEQVDPPDVIYRWPSNRYVGSFLGDANLLSAVIVAKTNDETVVKLSTGERITIPQTSPQETGVVTLFVRPEDFVLASTDSQESVVATVLQTVFMGDSIRVYLTLQDGSPLVISVAGDVGSSVVTDGAQVRVGIKRRNARLLVS